MDNKFDTQRLGKSISESVCSSCFQEYYFDFPLTDQFCLDCDPILSNGLIIDKKYESEHDKIISHTYNQNNTIDTNRNIILERYGYSQSRNKKIFLNELRKLSGKVGIYTKEYMKEYRKTDSYKLWWKNYISNYRLINKKRIKSSCAHKVI